MKVATVLGLAHFSTNLFITTAVKYRYGRKLKTVCFNVNYSF